MAVAILDETEATARSKGISIDPTSALIKRIENTLLIGVPFAGSLYSIVWFASHPLTWIEISCFLAMYTFVGIGIGIGFHRCMTHQAFKPVWPMKVLILTAGSFAFQGSVLRWVADHRRHHRFSDLNWDTHSPYADEQRNFSSRLAGLWHAHMGWMFDRTTTINEVYAPDLLKDRLVMAFHNFYWPITALGLAVTYAYGLCLGGSEHAIGCLLFAGCLRTTVFHHITWGVNSIGHTFGQRDADSRDSSRNNFSLAMLTFGEGWHRNHHAIPRSAYNDWKWYQLDFNAWIIRALTRIGLITDVVIASQLSANDRVHDVIPVDELQQLTDEKLASDGML